MITAGRASRLGLLGLLVLGLGGLVVNGCGDFDPDVAGGTSTSAALGSSELLSAFARRSLMLTTLSTVNDPKRTSDPCQTTPAPDANKKWTFGYLMSQAANQASTGVTPSNFVKAWLKTFAAPPVIGADQPAAGGVGGQIDADWMTKSNANGGNGSYLIRYAPFRLLAIVPRFDLRANRRFGEGNAGELRFVFSQVRIGARIPEPNGTCGMADGTTIILEYAVDRKDENAVQQWASSWNNLARIDPSSEAYRAAVETLTESVVKAGASPGRPNGSSLIRIRTNGVPSAMLLWDLREWVLDRAAKVPVPVRVKQSPRTVLLEGTNPQIGTLDQAPPPFDCGALGDWINSHEDAIFADRYVVPDNFPSAQEGGAFLGGFNLNNLFHNRAVYSARIHSNDARHLFGKGTCVGCHSVEAGPLDAHFHIAPRRSTVESQLSDFLTGTGEGQVFQVIDPIDPGTTHFFNDLGRREDDVLKLINNAAVVPIARAVPVAGEPNLAGQNYKIMGVRKNKCLEVKDSSTAAGASLQLSDCNGNPNQRLMVEDQGNSVSHLRFKSSGKCLQASSTSNAITQQTCSTNAGQNVYVEQLRAINFVLRFQRGNGDQCVDSQIPGSTGISAVVQKPCLFDGSPNAVFIE